VATRFGALLGTGEYMALVKEDCPSQFLEFFTRDGVSEAEQQAFEEFLFNLTHEDLARLRAAMKREQRTVVDSEFVARVLEFERGVVPAVDDPEELYRSYRRRRTAVEYRRIARAPGPLRVAEAYLMVFVLGARDG
jgi:hypothetical protein